MCSDLLSGFFGFLLLVFLFPFGCFFPFGILLGFGFLWSICCLMLASDESEEWDRRRSSKTKFAKLPKLKESAPSARTDSQRLAPRTESRGLAPLRIPLRGPLTQQISHHLRSIPQSGDCSSWLPALLLRGRRCLRMDLSHLNGPERNCTALDCIPECNCSF